MAPYQDTKKVVAFRNGQYVLSCGHLTGGLPDMIRVACTVCRKLRGEGRAAPCAAHIGITQDEDGVFRQHKIRRLLSDNG